MRISFCEVDSTVFDEHFKYIHENFRYFPPINFKFGSNNDLIEKLLVEHPEIQIAILETRPSAKNNNTITLYEPDIITTQDCGTIGNNCAILYRFFEKINLIAMEKQVYGYQVERLRPEAEIIYLSLKKSNLLNPYAKLIEQKMVDVFKEPFTIYKFSGEKRDGTIVDPYLKYLKKITSIHSFVGLPICGFTKKEIVANRKLQTLINSIGNIYILFSNDISIGAYVF